MVYLKTFLLVSHVDRIKMAIIIKKDVEEKCSINRSSESMRDRYRKYLKYITDNNIFEIIDFFK